VLVKAKEMVVEQFSFKELLDKYRTGR